MFQLIGLKKRGINMAITVMEALQIPVMKQTKLIAGLDGLDNNIKWVTVVEVIEDFNRLQDGEFLITTCFGLKESEEERLHFQKLLSMKKLSGIALYSGFYLQEIPEAFIQIANENGLPLIEIPIHINFSEITKAILEQLVNNQMQLMEYSLSIHQELTKLALGDQGLTAITETLSRLINGSVILFNSLYEITHCELKTDNVELIDQGTIIINSQEVPLKPYLEEIMVKAQPSGIGIQNLKLQFLPIIANQKNFGFIVTIKTCSQWGELDNIALEHAATVYAIEYLKKWAIQEMQLRLQGDFLEEILQQNFNSSTSSIDRGENMGFDITLNQAVLQIKINNSNSDTNNKITKEIVNQLIQIVQHVLEKKQRQFMIRHKLDSIILVCEIKEGDSLGARAYTLELADEIHSRWGQFFPEADLDIGIGKNYSDINKLSQSALEAKYALTFSKLLLKPQKIVHYDDLGMYHILIKMKESGMDLQELYEENLGQFLNPENDGMDSFLTLESYLIYNQSIKNTAAELFIHRHTLNYRLKQIKKKTGFDLDSADTRMKLLLAIMAFKLINYLEEPPTLKKS